MAKRLDWLTYSLLVLASAFLILRFPQEIRFDQNFLHYSLSLRNYPTFDSGVLSNILASLVNSVFHVAPERLNAIFKTFTMLFFTGSAFALARAVLTRPGSIAVFCLFLFTSRAPFLWLSSELLAGGFLCLCFLAIWRNWSLLVTGMLIAALGFTKPDLMLVSLSLLFYIFWRARKDKKARTPMLWLGFAGVALALCLPGLAFRTEPFFGNRAFGSFSQHYADLLSKHQSQQPAPNPWMYPQAYSATTFPEAHSMKDVVTRYPSLYADYLALSAAKGVKNLIRLFHFLLLLLPFRVLLAWRGLLPLLGFEKLVYLTLIGLAPHLAFSYPHVRYLVRYYPALLIAMLAVSEAIFHRRPRAKHRTPEIYWLSATAIFLIFVAGLAWQTGVAVRDLSHFRSVGQFWFPD